MRYIYTISVTGDKLTSNRVVEFTESPKLLSFTVLKPGGWGAARLHPIMPYICIGWEGRKHLCVCIIMEVPCLKK